MLPVLLLVAAVLAESACAESGAAEGERRWKRTVAPANGLSGLDAVRLASKVVVVGGADYDQTEVKALVLDRESGRWSRAARSRLPWRAGHSVIAGDGEVIVWGGSPGTGAAAYAPSRDEWRRIPPGPLAGRYRHSAVWTGDEMIVWGGQVRGRPHRDGAAYDPTARRWRTIAPAPLSARSDHAAVWTGEEMIVWGGSRSAHGERAKPLSGGAAYNPRTNTWRRLPPAPIRAAPSPALGAGVEVDLDAAWTGSQVLIWNGIAGAAYRPGTDGWRLLPASPRKSWLPTDTAVWTGIQLIVFGGTSALAYDPANRSWATLPRAPIRPRDRHAAVWTGNQMLIFGGCCRDSRHHSDGALYRPVCVLAGSRSSSAWSPSTPWRIDSVRSRRFSSALGSRRSARIDSRIPTVNATAMIARLTTGPIFTMSSISSFTPTRPSTIAIVSSR
jgi:Kelch motif